MLDIFNIKNKPHAIIFSYNGLIDINSYIKKYIKSILNDSKYDEKVDSLTYIDLFWFENNSEIIKKEDIITLISRFSSTGTEKSNKKFYVIKNIELCNKQTTNALLKFLEEPFDEIYAIFTSANISKVLPTIVSRCQVYPLVSSKAEKLSLLSSFNLSTQEKDIVIDIYKDLDNLKYDIENTNLHELIVFSSEMIKAKNDVVMYKKTFETFRKKSYYEIELIVKILLSLTKAEGLVDILDSIKLNPVKPLLFDKIIQLIKH